MAEGSSRLRAWTVVDELVLEIHVMTRRTAAGEHNDLVSRMRSAALGAVIRVVQGVHGNEREFDLAMRSALGSLAEFRYYLYLAKRIGIIDLRQYRSAAVRHDRVQKFLGDLVRTRGPDLPTLDPAASLPPHEHERATDAPARES